MGDEEYRFNELRNRLDEISYRLSRLEKIWDYQLSKNEYYGIESDYTPPRIEFIISDNISNSLRHEFLQELDKHINYLIERKLKFSYTITSLSPLHIIIEIGQNLLQNISISDVLAVGAAAVGLIKLLKQNRDITTPPKINREYARLLAQNAHTSERRLNFHSFSGISKDNRGNWQIIISDGTRDYDYVVDSEGNVTY